MLKSAPAAGGGARRPGRFAAMALRAEGKSHSLASSRTWRHPGEGRDPRQPRLGIENHSRETVGPAFFGRVIR